jgi:dihydrofolate reductase
VTEAVERAAAATTGDRHVHVMGGADVIRQALAAHLVDQLSIITAPVLLGAGKRLFEGFTDSIDFEPLAVRQSPFATFVDYRVKS